MRAACRCGGADVLYGALRVPSLADVAAPPTHFLPRSLLEEARFGVEGGLGKLDNQLTWVWNPGVESWVWNPGNPRRLRNHPSERRLRGPRRPLVSDPPFSNPKKSPMAAGGGLSNGHVRPLGALESQTTDRLPASWCANGATGSWTKGQGLGPLDPCSVHRMLP